MIKNFNSQLIESKDHLLLAISGGIDSMVMLDYLIRVKDEYDLTLSVAHVDHNKRSDAKDDASFVKQVANEHQLDFYLFELETNTEDNFHDYAHRKRYEFFAKTAKDIGANKVVLAHHLDDLAETIMMRLIRGSSFEGYQGIPETSTYDGVNIIRPLLNVTKESIKLYQTHYDVSFKEDASNQEDDYTRNRFRHQIMPLLKKENPQYLDKLLQFHQYQSNAYQLIESQTNIYYETLNHEQASISLNAIDFQEQLSIIQFETIKKIVNQLTLNQLELTYQNITDMIQIIQNEKPHVTYHLGDALFVYKSYQSVTFQNHPKDQFDYLSIVRDFGHYHINENIDVYIAKIPNKSYDYLYKLCYNNLDLAFPLTIRNRRPGDRLDIQIGTKKLKDFFIDKKIPMETRNQLPLIINHKKEILFIPSLYSKNTSGEDSFYIHVNIR